VLAFTAADAYAQWKTFRAVTGQREARRDGQQMQSHAGHFRRVLVADPQRKTARHDVAVADRLHFVDAELLDAFVERTRHRHRPISDETTTPQNCPQPLPVLLYLYLGWQAA